MFLYHLQESWCVSLRTARRHGLFLSSSKSMYVIEHGLPAFTTIAELHAINDPNAIDRSPQLLVHPRMGFDGRLHATERHHFWWLDDRFNNHDCNTEVDLYMLSEK